MSAQTSSSESPAGFPLRLRQLRLKLGLSQDALGKGAGVHFTHISKYERGLSKPNGSTLQGLARELGVSADFLLEGTVSDAGRADFEDLELLRLFEKAQDLPASKKKLVKEFLSAFVLKAELANMMQVEIADSR